MEQSKFRCGKLCKLKKNYLRIKFEDLCSNPTNNIELITQFLDVKKIDLTLIADKIKKPETLSPVLPKFLLFIFDVTPIFVYFNFSNFI